MARRSSRSDTASLWTPLIIWPYTSIVVEMLLCPRRSAIVRACTPLAISKDAAVCRRPCRVSRGSPAVRTIREKSLLTLSPLIGVPSSFVKTCPLPYQSSPKRRCCSVWATRILRSIVKAVAFKAMVRRDLLFLGWPSTSPLPSMRCRVRVTLSSPRPSSVEVNVGPGQAA